MLPKMGRKLKQSLEVPILTRELNVFTSKDLCFGTCRQVVCECLSELSVLNKENSFSLCGKLSSH